MMGLTQCGGGGGQLMRLNAEGQLGVGERCVDANTNGIRLIFCPSASVSGPWHYDKGTKQLLHKTSKRCLSAKGGKPGLEKCQELSSNQKWVFIESKPHWA